MLCCGGAEEENYGGPPASQYTAPPRGAGPLGAGGNTICSLFMLDMVLKSHSSWTALIIFLLLAI